MAVSLILLSFALPGLYCIIQDVKDEYRYYNNYNI